MLNLLIEIKGKTQEDLSNALQEVQKKVDDGFTSGFDKDNENGKYEFEITDEV